MGVRKKVSCAILISHYNSLDFLHACVRQIIKYRHPDIDQHIYIIDQSDDSVRKHVVAAYGGKIDITIVQCEPHYSGFGIDFIIRFFDLTEDYICQLHVDAFPISHNWLNLPITLIEENDYKFVGQLQFISKPTDTIYPPNVPFFSMAQCFNVAPRDIYTEMSLQAGFTRYHERNKVTKWADFANRDWKMWAKRDYEHRGSDDDVVAFYWEDKYRQHDKLGLAITGYIEPSYGRIIEDIVFHFGSCREAIGVMNQMPSGYIALTKQIHFDYSDGLIDYMLHIAARNKPPELEILSRNHWNGVQKLSSPTSDQMNNKIEYLKRMPHVDSGTGITVSN